MRRGWRLAVAYDLIARLGWRCQHGGNAAALLTVCGDILDAMP